MGKKFITKKVASGIQKLAQEFQERKNAINGLKKFETIHAIYGIPIKKILVMRTEKINSLWNKITLMRNHLRKLHSMAIISKPFPRGTELNDTINGFGKRMLKKPEQIYWRCFNMDDATGTRDDYDKKARGFINAGNQIVELTNEQIEQKPIMDKLTNNQNETQMSKM